MTFNNIFYVDVVLGLKVSSKAGCEITIINIHVHVHGFTQAGLTLVSSNFTYQVDIYRNFSLISQHVFLIGSY